MFRFRIFGCIAAGAALLSAAIAGHSAALAGGDSASKVKASATATKPNDKGQQVVTITLDIDKGWHIYANPVNANNEFLGKNQTKVTLAGKLKLAAVDVQYPPGKKHVDDTDFYDIYEGRVTIKANLQRAAGDTGPVEISIDVNACDPKSCLNQGKIKLTVP